MKKKIDVKEKKGGGQHRVLSTRTCAHNTITEILLKLALDTNQSLSFCSRRENNIDLFYQVF